jgi:hypothetical protein
VSPSKEAPSPLLSVLDVLQVVSTVPMHMREAATLEKEQLRAGPSLVAERSPEEGRTLVAPPSPGSSRLHPFPW